ncbi:asparaginase domain-containing protein [Globicatella sulfidifaciens]
MLIINTGGMIAMSEDQTTGKVSPTSHNPLTNQSQYFKQLAQLTAVDYFHLPSPHITVEHLLELSHYIKKIQNQYDGIVITHGTDTLEETAYFWGVGKK